MCRDVYLLGEINNENVSKCISEILLLDSESDEDINLYISSNGGSVDDGFSLIEIMNIVNSKIRTIVIDKAYSMAAIILACGNERLAFENSFVMIHEVIANIKKIEEAEKTFELIVKLLSKKTGKDSEEIRKASSFDNFLTAKEALEFKLIDKII